MSINNNCNSSRKIFSARNEKEHIANMMGRSDVFHILWSLDCFIHSNIYQATNSVLGGMKMSLKRCCPAGFQSHVGKAKVNTQLHCRLTDAVIEIGKTQWWQYALHEHRAHMYVAFLAHHSNRKIGNFLSI